MQTEDETASDAAVSAYLQGGRQGPRRDRQPLTDYERLFLPRHGRLTAGAIRKARREATMWGLYVGPLETARAWLQTGLRPEDHQLPALLTQQGLNPDRCRQPAPDGSVQTLAQWLVGRLGPHHSLEWHQRRAEELLDEAGVERQVRRNTA